MNRVIEERRKQREVFLEEARRFVARLSTRVDIEMAFVVGSVARGDFNVWSDVDVLIVAEGLEPRAPDRGLQLNAGAPERFQVIGLTPAEFESARRKRNPLAVEAESDGIALL